MSSMQKIGVLGAGAWGTALAAAARRAGRDVVLWSRRPILAEALEQTHQNPDYLPGIDLDPAIEATAALERVTAVDALLLVTPAQRLRDMAGALSAHLQTGCPVVSCSKGIEDASGKTMSEVLADVLPDNPVAVLSGPTFAAEVARGQPSATTLAANDPGLAAALVTALGSRSFRPYQSDDPIGAEIGGAVKNVMAIACGIVAGRSLGDNTRAALITRGLAEIGRLSLAKGGRRETLMGLSGLGDLTLTCSAMQSRNFSLGYALGQGRPLSDILAERASITEGVFSARAVSDLATRLGLEMPITESVDAVLNKSAEIDPTIEALLARPFKSEHI
ncbi:MAG: NAD(P)H-dependent glycerol-3-phosphate dehydrogenase [Pseudomonadota bacterium]